MKTVTFPILNLKLNINPVAIKILGIEIYWYGIIIVASILLALFLSKKENGTFNIKHEQILNLSMLVIPIAFVGARIYYVLFNLKEYTNLWEILNIKDGGIAIYGGILAGMVALYFYCKKHKINPLDVLDYLAPYLSLGQAIGRWGNFINVEAYGIPTNLPWKMGIQEQGMTQYVHPTFLYESIGTFLLFLVLQKISKNRKFKGEITYLYFIGYSLLRFLIEPLRADSLLLKNYKISQLVSAVLFVGFCTIMFKKTKKQNKITK